MVISFSLLCFTALFNFSDFYLSEDVHFI